MTSRPPTGSRPTAEFGEFAAIGVLQRLLTSGLSSRGPSSQVRLGIGDDAAILVPKPNMELVWSIDASVQGVHFKLDWLTLDAAAERAFHAAVSDLAAMGATPLAAVVALELPSPTTRRQIAAIGRGQARAARELKCPVIGGNVTRGRRFGFTTSVLGSVAPGQARRRSKARVGDEVWLSQPVGWAGLGLHLLQNNRVTLGPRGGLRWGASGAPLGGERAVRAWQQPKAQCSTGRLWASHATSLIDISDGLASEARHLAQASGVRVILDQEALRAMHRQLVAAAAAAHVDADSLMLNGGEDYALLGTGPGARRPSGAGVIGRTASGTPGVYLQTIESGLVPITASGFDHLSVATTP